MIRFINIYRKIPVGELLTLLDRYVNESCDTENTYLCVVNLKKYRNTCLIFWVEIGYFIGMGNNEKNILLYQCNNYFEKLIGLCEGYRKVFMDHHDELKLN